MRGLTSLRHQAWYNHVMRIVLWIRKYPGLIAAVGFVSGLASFFLVKRHDGLAKIIAIVLLVSWLWLVLEGLLRGLIERYLKFSIPLGVLRYLTQLVHQESLFFILPFYLVTTTWLSGQLIFTGLLIIAALVSITDPLYYRALAPRRWLYLAYHSLALFSALLCVLPLLLHISTARSFELALLGTLILSLPSFASLLGLRSWKHFLAVVISVVGVGFIAWGLRAWVPPATLWLKEAHISQQLDRSQKKPSAPVTTINVQTLKAKGLYAYAAIRAPRGLNERIYHQWLHNGQTIDVIALDISGGREEGFRAWSHKRNFPTQPVGHWQVRVITESKQLLGTLAFEVTP